MKSTQLIEAGLPLSFYISFKDSFLKTLQFLLEAVNIDTLFHMKNRRVFIGLSGGVDSSVSAALLKEQGYDVVGIFIKVWSPDWLPCTWREERLDAMRVAAHLDIPFITLDLESAYKANVVDYMVDEYKRGRVPNPDVMCNKTIKFGAFFDWARENGADYVATGHYARVETSEKLLKGVDKNKDQSYFLWTIGNKQLKKTIFPIGEYPKPKVRELAKKYKLPTAQKKDSQGLCFVGKVDMKEFLQHFIDKKSGDILDTSGRKIGTHDGVVFYTIGQRHGFKITKKGTEDSPYYIVAKDVNKNTITISPDKKDEKFVQKKVEIINTNWINGIPKAEKKYTAKLWYRAELIDCTISIKDKVYILFTKPHSISFGQSFVLYDGDTCLGGGVVA